MSIEPWRNQMYLRFDNAGYFARLSLTKKNAQKKSTLSVTARVFCSQDVRSCCPARTHSLPLDASMYLLHQANIMQRNEKYNPPLCPPAKTYDVIYYEMG